MNKLEQFFFVVNDFCLSNGICFANAVDRRVDVRRLRLAWLSESRKIVNENLEMTLHSIGVNIHVSFIINRQQLVEATTCSYSPVTRSNNSVAYLQNLACSSRLSCKTGSRINVCSCPLLNNGNFDMICCTRSV